MNVANAIRPQLVRKGSGEKSALREKVTNLSNLLGFGI
jgi:hypothetical protein